MANVWIDPELTKDDKYAYNATLSDADIRVRLTLKQAIRAADGWRYQMEWSSEKAARGPLGTRQKQKARALKAELEPQFRQALAEAGWVEARFGLWGMLWTRED
jgi:hypothetical protein